MDKVDSLQEADMKILKKNQNEMLEIKNTNRNEVCRHCWENNFWAVDYLNRNFPNWKAKRVKTDILFNKISKNCETTTNGII